MFNGRPPLEKAGIVSRTHDEEAAAARQERERRFNDLDERVKTVLEKAVQLATPRYQGKLDLYVPETGRNFMLWTYESGGEKHVLPVINATRAEDEHLRNNPDLAASTNIGNMCIVQPDGALFRLDMHDGFRREGAKLSIVSVEDKEGSEYGFVPGLAESSEEKVVKLTPSRQGSTTDLTAKGEVGGKHWSLVGSGISYDEPDALEALVLGLENSIK